MCAYCITTRREWRIFAAFKPRASTWRIIFTAKNQERSFDIELKLVHETFKSFDISKHVDEHIKRLGIIELYSAHKDNVCEVHQQRYIFGEAYVDALTQIFPNLFRPQEDTWAILYI